MQYLSAKDILVIHVRIVDTTSGNQGIRDVGLLASLALKPQTTLFGKETYQRVFLKAAVYLESIATYHVFTDGNKRTAIAAAARFLDINGYTLTASNKEVEHFVVDVVIKRHPLEKIAQWFKKYSKRKKK